MDYGALFNTCMLGMCYSTELVQKVRKPVYDKKKDFSVVTDYDFAIQIIFCSLLREFDLDIVAEEEDSREYQELLSLLRQKEIGEKNKKKKMHKFFQKIGICLSEIKEQRHTVESKKRVSVIIDPIDGTKGFINQRVFSVVVSAVVEDYPIFSIISSPKEGKIFYKITVPEKTAGEFGKSGDGQKDRETYGVVSERKTPTEISVRKTALQTFGKLGESLAIRIGLSFESAHSDAKIERVIEEIERVYRVSVQRIDGQCKYLYLSTGKLDLYIRIPDRKIQEKIWDHCAGIHMASGCIITDIEGKKLAPTTPTSYGVVASVSENLHKKIIDIIEKVFLK